MTQKEPKTPQIVITDREPGLPFSKGLLASQVMVTGLSPVRAYEVADAVEDRLLEAARTSVTSQELSDVAFETIREIASTGVTYVSVGRLTQSAPAADIGLDFRAV